MELMKLTQVLREKFEQTEKGFVTKAEFLEFQEKLDKDFDIIRTALQRPAFSAEHAASDEKKAVFFKWMRGDVLTKEEKALVSDATGQILIPEALEAEIYRSLPKVTVVRGLATVRQINTDRIRKRSLTEVQVGWGKLETGTTITESTLVPSEDHQYVEDLYGLAKIGEDELADTDVALESIVADSFVRAIAEAEDTAFIAGRGHASREPEGILTGTNIEAINAGQAGAITTDDVISLCYALRPQYRKNAVLIMNSKTEKALRLLKTTDGVYLWQPSLQAGAPATFNGYPVYNQDDIPNIPQAGTAAKVIIFGDLRAGYRILDRLGVTVQRLVELYAENGLVGFKAHFRVGGGVIRPDAIKVLRVPAS